jgi:hypothetical protein
LKRRRKHLKLVSGVQILHAKTNTVTDTSPAPTLNGHLFLGNMRALQREPLRFNPAEASAFPAIAYWESRVL